MRSLVIGYGNPSRRDDAAAMHVLNALRARWGRPALTAFGDNWEDLGAGHGSLLVQQLMPELAATVAEYDVVVFVDAALAQAEAVRAERVTPALRLATVSHHADPATLLALAEQLFGRAPAGWLVSVRGHDLSFGEELAPETAAAIPGAVDRVARLIGESPR